MMGTDLEIAGQVLREHVIPTENAQARVRGRARLIRYFDQPRRRPRTWPALAMAAAVVALVLPLGWWWRSDDRGAITFTEGPDRLEGKVGAYVSPPIDIRWALAFSDGSMVELQPESHGRVTRTTSRGAQVLLENGRARVEVVHRPKTDWSILAGPYTVRVTGTSFEVAFEARTQTLEVVMRSGTVLVEGPGISTPVEIQGAQRFLHRAGSPEVSSGPAPLPSSEPGSVPRASTTPPTASAEAPRAVAHPSGPASASAAGPSWAALAARGQYQAVLEQAERLGLGRALSTTKPADLMALGHAARFAGRTDLAARAYQATRARFGATSDAANAAFFLGRMVEGQSPNMAIGWYERYVSETPRGTWVAEALGRRMVLLKKSGAHEAALEAARQYQERFPKGPYAGVAREMTTPP